MKGKQSALTQWWPADISRGEYRKVTTTDLWENAARRNNDHLNTSDKEAKYQLAWDKLDMPCLDYRAKDRPVNRRFRS